MKRIIFAVLCGLFVFNTGIVRAEKGAVNQAEQTASQSALDLLESTRKENNGLIEDEESGYIIDVKKIGIAPSVLKYWQGMSIEESGFGVDKSGRRYYGIKMRPLKGNEKEMPALVISVHATELHFDQNNKNTPIYVITGTLHVWADGVLVYEVKQEMDAPSDAKPGDQCTIGKPCDSMKKHEPCPHDRGSCEHQRQMERDKHQAPQRIKPFEGGQTI
jgi:hypothetical protein